MAQIMKKPARLILPFVVAATVALTFPVTTSANAPFDFSYRVTGATNLQPALIFNDGVDTFIEPGMGGDSVRVVGAQSSRQGPYIVVFGLPDEFALVNARNERATIHRQVARQPAPAPAPASLPERAVPAPVATTPTVAAIPELAQPTSTINTTPAPAQPTSGTPSPTVETRPTAVTQEGVPVSDQPRAVATQGTADQCKARTTSDSAFVAVQFKDNATDLSAEAQSRLKSASVHSGLSAVRIRHMPSQNSRLDQQRSAHLERLISQAGVSDELISRGADGVIDGMFEIEFVTSKTIPCVGDSPVVTAANGMVSVISLDADADALLSELANNLGLRYSTEGDSQAIPISVQFASAPVRDAFAAIGRELGGRATLILRDHELVLRYSNN